MFRTASAFLLEMAPTRAFKAADRGRLTRHERTSQFALDDTGSLAAFEDVALGVDEVLPPTRRP